MFFKLKRDIIKFEKIEHSLFSVSLLFQRKIWVGKFLRSALIKMNNEIQHGVVHSLNSSAIFEAHQSTKFRYEFSFNMFIVLICIFFISWYLLAIHVSHICLNQTNQWTSPKFVFNINISATNQMNYKYMSCCQHSPYFYWQNVLF